MNGAQRGAVRADRPAFGAIEHNVAGLAHDLANLAQVVNGYLELAIGCTEDEQTLRYLANARLAAQQIAELSRRIREHEE